jgi:hypothetical protein
MMKNDMIQTTTTANQENDTAAEAEQIRQCRLMYAKHLLSRQDIYPSVREVMKSELEMLLLDGTLSRA